MKHEEVYVEFYNGRYFNKRHFKDMDGGYWETEKQRDQYDEGEKYEIPWLESELAPCIIAVGSIVPVKRDELHLIRWGVKRVLYERDHPEYYI